MDKGFERCCDLIAKMIEKYGDKMLQEIKKENAYQIQQWKTDNEGRKNRYVAYYKLVLYISLEKRQLRKNRGMYKKNMLLFHFLDWKPVKGFINPKEIHEFCKFLKVVVNVGKKIKFTDVLLKKCWLWNVICHNFSKQR